jgi:hypothetical protein
LDHSYLSRFLWQKVFFLRSSPVKAESLLQDNAAEIFLRLRKQRQEAKQHLDLPDLVLALQYYEVYLNQIIDQAVDKNVRLIMMTQPSLWRKDLDPSEISMLWAGGLGDFFSTKKTEYYSIEALEKGLITYNEKLEEVAAARGVEVIDLAEALPKDRSVFYDDMHFNLRGAEKVASLVAGYLLRHPSAKSKSSSSSTVQNQPVDFEQATDLAVIKNWGPHSTTQGMGFSIQGNGNSAMWFELDRKLPASAFIMIDNRPLATTRADKLCTASIEGNWIKEKLSQVGQHEISLIDFLRQRRQTIGMFEVKK